MKLTFEYLNTISFSYESSQNNPGRLVLIDPPKLNVAMDAAGHGTLQYQGRAPDKNTKSIRYASKQLETAMRLYGQIARITLTVTAVTKDIPIVALRASKMRF